MRPQKCMRLSSKCSEDQFLKKSRESILSKKERFVNMLCDWCGLTFVPDLNGNGNQGAGSGVLDGCLLQLWLAFHSIRKRLS